MPAGAKEREYELALRPQEIDTLRIESTGGVTLRTQQPIEGFAIKTAEDVVCIVGHDGAIAGRSARSDGTAHGVREFAERFVGVRWYFLDQ